MFYCALVPDKGNCFRVRFCYTRQDDLALKTKLLRFASSNGPAVKRSMVLKDFEAWEAAGFALTGKEKGSYREMSFTPKL